MKYIKLIEEQNEELKQKLAVAEKNMPHWEARNEQYKESPCTVISCYMANDLIYGFIIVDRRYPEGEYVFSATICNSNTCYNSNSEEDVKCWIEMAFNNQLRSEVT